MQERGSDKKIDAMIETLISLSEMEAEASLANLLDEAHPGDIAEALQQMDRQTRRRVIDSLPPEKAADTLASTSEEIAAQIAEDLDLPDLVDVVEEMEPDEAADLLGDMPPEKAEEVLSVLEPEDAADVRELLLYEEDTAGGIMTTEVISVRKDSTIGETIEEIRSHPEAEHFYLLFVTDDDGKLAGSVPFQRLLFHPPGEKIGEIMDNEILTVPVDMDQEEVADIFHRYDLLTLPVVDPDRRLLGRITVDDVMDVIEDEATEDIHRLGGIGEEDSVLDSPKASARRRLPWLFVNLVTASLAASVIGLFTPTISRLVILAMFMPIVAGIGGNAGSQTVVVITRAIALGELSIRNAMVVIMRQVGVGLILGISIGTVMTIIGFLWAGNPWLGGVLGAAIFANILVATLIGTLIPLALSSLRIDPAVASSVFVTAFTDLSGFVVFLGTATIFIERLAS